MFSNSNAQPGFLQNALRKISFSGFSVLLLGMSLAVQAHAQQSQQQYTPPPPPPPANQNAPQEQPAPPPEQQPQEQAPPAPLAPQQLDTLVSRIALYPDPLLAQILTAATFSPDIPAAANWANEHATISSDALAAAIQQDNLPWDPSVLALLPFPSVLQMMAQDPQWTDDLGDAVLVQRPDVMDAVQRMRQQAYNYGYLQPSAYDNVVNTDGYIEVLPVNPAYLYVPIYSPGIVFFAPRPGFAIGFGIRFAPSIFIGPAFFSFGWAHPGFAWRTHGIVIGGAPWGRTWSNRAYYRHSYANAYHPRPGPRIENHANVRYANHGHAEASHGGGSHGGGAHRH
ncbi:MAG TPA: DUF3300 domain-containing protein [Acidobacteriaceae bacterium]|nr:DUF3300 domain-containing protein [Acidobacteriaceae bacterium]